MEAEVPEEEPIDVAGLAVSMTASSGDWDGKLTAEQCAAQLFDGNEDTYGDLKTGNTYTIDFGDGTTVTPSKFAVYPRKGTGNKPVAEFVARLNGLKFQGSNDGVTWVDITAALADIAARDEAAVKWHELAVTTTDSYRYIQITGAEGGNLAEVKVYGTVSKSELPDAAEDLIDVSSLAVSMTASSGDWNNTLTAEQCAAQLFDGNEDTFGDLKTGNTYTIDFGDGTTLTPSKFAVYPRKGTGNKPVAEFVARLNGLKFQGSNDGVTWVDITAALADIAARDEAAVKWHELAVTTTDSYRYIQITGAEGGNLAEVKFYGTVNKTSTAALTEESDASVATEPEAATNNAEATPEVKPETSNSDTVIDAKPETGNAVTDAEEQPETGSSEAAADKTPETDNSEAAADETPETDNSEAAADETPETDNSEAAADETPETDNSEATTDKTPETDSSDETAASEIPEAPEAQPTDAIAPELTVTPEEEIADDNTDTPVDAE